MTRPNFIFIVADDLGFAELKSPCAANWEDWHASMLPIPAEATISPVYGLADMPQR